MIKNKNKIIDGWRCEKIKEIKYTESSSFNNLLDKISNKITIENIYTKEKIKFNSSKELSDYLGFKGHNILDYYNTKHTLMDKWKIITNRIVYNTLQNLYSDFNTIYWQLYIFML